MITTIQFIGLIVTTMLSGTTTPPAPPPGVQAIIGKFPGTVPPHLRIIAYPRGSRVDSESNWKVDGNYTTADGTIYDYVTLNLEVVDVTGPTVAFDNQIGDMPHLTCCCPEFNNGFNPDWGNPTAGPSSNSAFVTFKNGTYTTVVAAPKPPATQGAVSTVLLIDDPANITFTGTQASSPPKKLVIKPGFDLVVANEPKCVLEGKNNCPHMSGDPDFWSYYKMGKGTQGCKAVPTSGPCKPGPSSCPPRASAGTPRKPKLSAKLQSRIVKLRRYYVDGVCSSSQWP